MLNITSLVRGRIYSFRHVGAIEFKQFAKVNGARAYAPEWLQSANVVREAAFKGNAACATSYANKMRQSNPEWTPEREAWFSFSSQDGIVTHNTTGKPYLALVNPEVIKETYFVDGVQATPEQIKEIKAWKKGGQREEKPVFCVFDLTDKVECTGELPA
jgi:hypothetical protein